MDEIDWNNQLVTCYKEFMVKSQNIPNKFDYYK